jgi:F-type H+-transporting ATPase subunit a
MITEILFLFVRDTLESCVGKRGFGHFPLVLSLFLFILCGNIFGLLPGAFTFTSHIIVTGFLAFVVFTIVILFLFVIKV